MEFGGLYGFQCLPKVKFPGFEKSSTQENLTKWSMIDGLKLQAFSFCRPFKKYLHEEFLKDFFSCPSVTSTLERATSDHRFGPVGVPSEKIQFSEVNCTITSMELFDKLFEDDLVARKSGSIIKCLPEYYNPTAEGFGDGEPLVEIELGDKLRKLIVMRKDEEVEDLEGIFSPEEREEFIFRLFGHLVIGGSLCQYEDFIHPYLETTKLLYKDLISVASSSESPSKLQILSTVYKIYSGSNDMMGDSMDKNLFFNKPQLNNFFYIIVNPTKQTCFTLYHHV